MKQISGILESIIIADEKEILCKIKLDEILSPFFSMKNLQAKINAIVNVTDNKEILKRIHLLVGQRFNGIFLQSIGHNIIEIQIQ